jgi:hypothetical protein
VPVLLIGVCIEGGRPRETFVSEESVPDPVR